MPVNNERDRLGGAAREGRDELTHAEADPHGEGGGGYDRGAPPLNHLIDYCGYGGPGDEGTDHPLGGDTHGAGGGGKVE